MTAPSSSKLPVDRKLSYTTLLDSIDTGSIVRDIKQHLAIGHSPTPDEVKLHALTRDRPAFPKEALLVRLAVEAYNNSPREEIGEWKLLTVARNTAKTNGYFGVAYWNGAEQQVVIAQRGTASFSALYNDLQGIILNDTASQMLSAITFTNQVLQLIQELNSVPGIYVQLSITGHSLGGWLAQITTFSAKYLTLKDGHFVRNNEPNGGHHPHAVSFDSPGCKEMLMKMQDRLCNRLTGDGSLDHLDVTVYLSAPNMVNTLNSHIGKIYRIFIDLSQYRPPSIFWPPNKWVMYHINFTHNKLKIQAVFDSDMDTRRQEVIDWPRLRVTNREEYHMIFRTANESNDFVPESFVTASGHRDVRYSTRPVDPKVFKMSYLSQHESAFMSEYQLRCQFKSLEAIVSNDSRTVSECLHEKWIDFGFKMKHDDFHCETEEKVFHLVSLIRRYCHFYCQSSQQPLGPQSIMSGSFQTESNDYLSSHSNNFLDFNENTNLSSFLMSDLQLNNNQIGCNKFHWVEETTSVGALKVYRGSEKVELTRNCLFLNLNQLQMLSKHINLKELLRNNPHLVLVIECQSHCNSEEVENLWNDFPPATNKLVLITNQSFHFDNLPDSNTNHDDREIQFHRLTDETKKKIKNKLISVQNQKFQLGHLGVAESLSTATLISIGFDEPLSVGKELETLSEEAERCYIGRTLRMCTINPHIICSRNTNSDDVFVNWSVDNNNGLLNRDERALDLNDYMEVKLQVVTGSKIKDKVVFVIGKAGMGKTTLFTHLANKIKISDPKLWVIRLNFSQLLQFHEVSDNNIFDTLIRALHLKSDTEIEFVKLYLNLKKLVVFVDGVDQTPQPKDRVWRLVKDLMNQKESFHQMWLSCRRESTYRQLNQGHTESSTAYTLQPFTQKEQRQFLRKFWSQNMVDFNEGIFKKYFDELIKSFRHVIGGKYDDFTRNPRILHIVGEHFHDQFRQFNYSNESVNVSKCNLWLSYRYIIVKYLNESSVESDVLNSIMKKCQLIALGNIFRTKINYLLSPDEIKELERIKSDKDSDLEQLWIIDEPSSEVSCFINGSFDEYFAGQYLIDQMNEPIQMDISNVAPDETMNPEKEYLTNSMEKLKREHLKSVLKAKQQIQYLKRECFFNWFLKAENKIICDRFELELSQAKFSKKFKNYMKQFRDNVSSNQQFVMTKLAHFYAISR